MFKHMLIKKNSDTNTAMLPSTTRTEETEAPKLFAFCSGGQLDVLCIGIDNFVVHLTTHNSFGWALLVCLVCYYVFDIVYPKHYDRILGLMQEFIIQEPFVWRLTCRN